MEMILFCAIAAIKPLISLNFEEQKRCSEIMETSNKTHVYMMPGMAADKSIFQYIRLPKSSYEIHLLEWLIPEKNELLQHYAERMCSFVKHENIVLIGVSFGGVLVQEMLEFVSVKRLIIISSVKSRGELPKIMKTASTTGLYRLLPTGLISHFDTLANLAVGDYAKKRVELYKKYLTITDTAYLDWAIENMVRWDREEPLPKTVHIHGDKDEIFPYKHIEGSILVPGGTHVMIINRFRWFNEHLEEIIETGKLEAQEELSETRKGSSDPGVLLDETKAGD